MRNKLSWKLLMNLRDYSMSQGEDIVKEFYFVKPPIDPFVIIKAEPTIYAEGADFGDAFDGRLEYLGNKYLLVYNTKYDNNRNKQDGLHPKIRFTIAHELGHYFLDEHRNILRNGGPEYSCTTEFQSDTEMELQADYFATGLLMPSHILSTIVNKVSEPDLGIIKDIAQQFQVSLTSMMIRWVKLSDFPCGIFSVTPNGIEWGWISDALVKIGVYRRKKGAVQSPEAKKFIQSASMDQYREGHGLSLLHYWVDTPRLNLSINEFYSIISYTKNMLVFFHGYEEEL